MPHCGLDAWAWAYGEGGGLGVTDAAVACLLTHRQPPHLMRAFVLMLTCLAITITITIKKMLWECTSSV